MDILNCLPEMIRRVNFFRDVGGGKNSRFAFAIGYN